MMSWLLFFESVVGKKNDEVNCRIGFWLKDRTRKQEIKLAHNYSPNLALLFQFIRPNVFTIMRAIFNGENTRLSIYYLCN
jgi:hypothetical protein